MATPSALRPLTVTGIVDAALQLMRTHYLLYVLLAVGWHVIVIALQFTPIATTGHASRLENWLIYFALLLASLLASAMTEACAAPVMADAYLRRPRHPGGAVRHGLSRGGVVLAAAVTRYAMILSGLLLIVPGFYTYFRTTCVVGVIVLDQDAGGPVAAIRRTWDLARGATERIMLTVLLVDALYFAVYLFVLAIARWLGAVVPALHGRGAQTMLTWLPLMLCVPVGPAVRTVLYYDLRVRNEAFDVELMSRALDVPAAV